MTGALDGIRVVDLTSYIAGSYGAMMLADLGADVIKVEAIEGDSFRELSGFYGWNRGKRSLAVNLKEPDGRAIVHRLAQHADVVMENMRPGVVERLGVDYETLRGGTNGQERHEALATRHEYVLMISQGHPAPGEWYVWMIRADGLPASDPQAAHFTANKLKQDNLAACWRAEINFVAQ